MSYQFICRFAICQHPAIWQAAVKYAMYWWTLNNTAKNVDNYTRSLFIVNHLTGDRSNKSPPCLNLLVTSCTIFMFDIESVIMFEVFFFLVKMERCSRTSLINYMLIHSASIRDFVEI